MTLDDLKEGMVVQRRDCNLAYVHGGRLIGLHGSFGSVDDYSYTLKSLIYNSKHYDIVKVYKSRAKSLRTLLTQENLELLWERLETREMTVQEIELALGYPIKVVK